MLASDLNNPAFVGAKNPDEMLHVEFHWGVVKQINGRPVLDENGKERKVPYVRISRPGDETSVNDTPVREDHKRRFRALWEHWQMQEGMGGVAQDVPGMSIDAWAELNEEQRRELKYLRFSVVEQIAAASDLQIQRLGAMGPGLRIKARTALRERMDASVKAEIAARDAKIAELQAASAKRDEEMERFKRETNERLDAFMKSKEEAPRKKPGRPKNKPKEVNDGANAPPDS